MLKDFKRMKKQKVIDEQRKLEKLKANGVIFTLNKNEFVLYFNTNDTFKVIVNGIEQSDLFTKDEAESVVKNIFDGKYSEVKL